MTGYPLSDFWRVADAEDTVTRCEVCGDAMHIGEVRAGWVRCFLHSASQLSERNKLVFKITVLSSLETHHHEAMVISDAPGFDGEHFSSRYDDDETAELVAHAMAAVLWGQGCSVLIAGCTCAGWHSSEDGDR